jgi:hypothetical protein
MITLTKITLSGGHCILLDWERGRQRGREKERERERKREKERERERKREKERERERKRERLNFTVFLLKLVLFKM